MERPKLHLAVVNDMTARDKEANKTLAEFASLTEQLSIECPRMAAFFVIVFDDEGHPNSKMYYGDMFPISSALLPEIIKDAVRARVHN